MIPQVTNPLSVKTKVHLPRSPTALLSGEERDKVFLEVHIQNLTQDAMWLERMQFECVDGWKAQDANYLDNATAATKDSLFTGSTALMQPQDVRQYIYILTPISLPPFPVSHAPGIILALGRLDISWRSSFGEPGRLLTSVRCDIGRSGLSIVWPDHDWMINVSDQLANAFASGRPKKFLGSTYGGSNFEEMQLVHNSKRSQSEKRENRAGNRERSYESHPSHSQSHLSPR